MQSIILDFDGTIGDTRSLIVSTMQQTIAELGLPGRTDDECAATIGLPLRQAFTDLLSIDDEVGERCAQTYSRIFDRDNTEGRVTIFPGVRQTIEEMHRRGLLVTIASSRSRGSLEGFVDSMGLRPCIPYIVSANDVEHAKPAPDMVLLTLRDNGLRPEDAMVVGDTVFDILMARAAGVRSVGVTYGNGTPTDLRKAGADHVIDHFADLLRLL